MKTILFLLKERKVRILLLPVISSLILLLSCVSQKVSGIRELASKTEFQKLPAGVKELWQTPMKDEEISQIVPFSDSKVLVQTINFEHYLSGTLYFYKYSDLFLVNTEDGKILWSYPTLNLEQKQQQIIAVFPSILILSMAVDTTSFVAINPKTGQQSWRIRLKGKTSYYLLPDNSCLFISSNENGSWVVQKLSVSDGKSLWKNIITGADNKDVYPFFVSGNDLRLVMGNKIFSLNVMDGSVRWQSGTSGDISSGFSSGNQLWIFNNQIITEFDNSTGKKLAEFSMSGKKILGTVLYDNSLLTSVYDTINKVSEIECYDVASHNLTWEFPVRDGLKSSLYKDNDYLYFTGRTTFYNIDMSSGKLRELVNLPDSLESQYLAIDDIWKMNNQFIINRENSMIILSKTDNAIVSDCYFGIAGGFTSSFLRNKIAEIRKMPSVVGVSNTRSIPDLYTDNTMYNMAKQNQAFVYARTAPVIANNSTASYSEKMSAYNQRIAATQNAYNQGAMQANMQMLQAGAQFGASVGNAIGGALAAMILPKIQAANTQIIDFAEEEIGSCVQQRNNSILDNLYFRPYFDKGWKLAIIDLNKPGYCSVPLMPDLVPFRYSDTHAVPFIIMVRGDSKLLLAKTYSSTPEDQETYRMRFFNHTTLKLDQWDLPKPVLACYDISSVQTGSKDPWAVRSPAILRPMDRDLVEGVFRLNSSNIKEMVKAGANVNAIDEFGHTALMHCAQIGDYKSVKILLKRGANPKLEDPEGLNAFDFSQLPLYEKTITIQNLAKLQKSLKRAYKKF